MKTITIDILNNKALDVLHDLELTHLIPMHKKEGDISKYKGTMQKQPINDLDKQIKALRNGWE